MMDLAGIEKRMNFVLTTDTDKMSERIEAAEVILREDVPALIAEIKRLRKQLELEHDQGESFLTQIKELQAENAALRKDKERLDWLDWLEAHHDIDIYMDDEGYVYLSMQTEYHKDLRAAIDAEMELNPPT